MRTSSRAVWLIAAAVNAVPLVACTGPRTSLVLPECADRVELSGQHRRMSERRIELDHTFDLPLTKTEITSEKIRDGRKTTETTTLVNNQPDLAHLLVGGVIGAGGGILTLIAVRDVVADGASPLSARPFYLTLFGAPAALGGVLVMSTGWHPDDETVISADCEEAPPGAPPMPPSTAAPSPDTPSPHEPPAPASSPPPGDDPTPL